MSSTVLQDALSVLDAAAVELPLKSRSFEATRQLLIWSKQLVNMFFIGYFWNRSIQSVSCISLLQTQPLTGFSANRLVNW
jgi:hypothetical protein